MSEHEWKPGDVAMVEAFWRHGIVQAEGAVRREDGWVSLLDGSYKPTGGEIKSVRPLVVIDPEDRAQVAALADAFCTQRWSHLPGSDECDPLTRSSMQAALRALANPTPEPLPEPTDPAVRVVDRDGDEWARIGNSWFSDEGARLEWLELAGRYGPLRIVTPDAPTPDADRPLKVGDRVRVADDGERNAGREGLVLGCHMRLRYATVETDEAWPFVVQQRRLTRIPGGGA